ncbi:3-hydroxyacyl-CoA dehydrogenase family protein [Streptococcus ictaluri]|uniref:3-hydroxyacyl-CoA dehydrogenase, NAD binding domain protein n=1 Tax=Streptococcus ictaluri 707-05 TaxID=764299 RepID=G5K2X9_9STRE|nr:3-hydroxyacyl-CoA dehydrogenase family protein [Streptococcus ictaluri]EHI69704.1 3-hydroxyacyl-CoA dehydrogenase, NAD binding domain protein [Streptococcus ictaluri 707-05]
MKTFSYVLFGNYIKKRYDKTIKKEWGSYMRRVTILGSGMMGKQIATFLINNNMTVDLVKVTDTKDWQKDLAKLEAYVTKRLFKLEYINRLQVKHLEDVLTDGITSDLVIEAVVEDLVAKQVLFGRVLAVIAPETIIATNTSTLSITRIAEGFKASEKNRFLGLHFFAPVRHMKLVEVIPHELLSQVYVKKINHFISNQLGKEAIVVKDVLGFLANRIGFFANHDVMRLSEHYGMAPELVDYLSCHALK